MSVVSCLVPCRSACQAKANKAATEKTVCKKLDDLITNYLRSNKHADNLLKKVGVQCQPPPPVHPIHSDCLLSAVIHI